MSTREKLWSLLGDLPPRNYPIGVVDQKQENRDGYTLQTLRLDVNGLEHVPAYVVLPQAHGEKLPVVIYNHAHAGDYECGKRELLEGRAQIQHPPYAQVCAENGWIGICIDAWNFGERHRAPESQVFKEMLWRGQVLWGMMLYDSIRLVDYVCTLPFVDPSRIATLGLSMGSTMSWWMAALDDRVKVCVDICCLTDFEELIRERALDEHGLYYYVPGLLKHFTTAQINALIAPRPHLALAGLQDPLTPARGLERVDHELKEAYTKTGAPEAWNLFTQNTGHQETPEMRALVVDWLKQHL